MYSTNTNNQQDRGRQALNVKPAPWGGHYIIHIEDVITDTGKHGLSIYNETLREADHETPASRVDTLLKTVIARKHERYRRSNGRCHQSQPGGPTMIDLFTATPAEREIIERIAKRAVALYRKYGNTDVDELDIQMDLEACHCNGCPLRLADMEQADNFNFMHDVTGINVHLNHDTGKLERCFLPRFTDMERRARRHD